MKKALPGRAMAMLSWLLLLVVIPVVFYGAHVFDQLTEVRDNNLRTLSKAATATSDIIRTAIGNVENLAGDCSFLEAFIERQPRLTLPDQPGTLCADTRNGQAEEEVESSSSGEDDEIQSWPAGLQVSSEGIQIWTAEDAGSRTPEREILFNVELAGILGELPFGDALDLLFVADNVGRVIDQHQPEGRTDLGLRITQLHELPLADGIGRLDSSVLLKSSATTNLELAGRDYELLCQPLLIPTTLVDARAEAAQRGTAPGAGLDTSVTPTDGQQPTQDTSITRQSTENWVLCGLVASQSLLTQSLQVAPFLALMLLMVIVFAFLSWPLIKLKLMSERDRLRFSDLGFLLFGTWAGLMLATVLVLSIGAHRELLESSEASLKSLATELEDHLSRELKALRSYLHALDDGFAEEIQRFAVEYYVPRADVGRLYADDHSLTFAPEEPPLISDFEFAFWARCDGNQIFKATIKEQNTPRVSLSRREYFQAVVQDRLWPRGGGSEPFFVQPLRSLTTGEFATVLSIESNISPSHTWNASGYEVIATGQGSRQVPAELADEYCAMMAAAEANLVSTTRPVLSPGVGFAIVNEQGVAVLHSDERRALFENLYEEIEDGDRLRAVVLSRQEAFLDTSYLGRPHSVFAKPLTDLPWSIVTFVDAETVSTNSLETIGHSFILIASYLFLFVLLVVGYLVAYGPEIPRWFWPMASRGGRVEWSMRIALAALPAFAIAVWLLPQFWALIATMLIPVAVVVAVYAVYCLSRRRAWPPARSHLELLKGNILASFVLWFVVALIPAASFFKFSLDTQTRALMRMESEHLAQQVEARTCAIEDYYRGTELSGVCAADGCQYPDGRIDNDLDLYPSTLFGPRFRLDPELTVPMNSGAELLRSAIFAAGADRAAPRLIISENPIEVAGDATDASVETAYLWNWLTWIKPLYNETVVKSRYFGGMAEDRDSALTTNWSWTTQNGDAVFSASPLQCGGRVDILSSAPLSFAQVVLNGWVLTLGALLLLALFFWTRYSARRIFFGEIEDAASPDFAALQAMLDASPGKSGQFVAAVVVSPGDRSKLLEAPTAEQRGRFLRIDASDFEAMPETRSALLSRLDDALASKSNVLLVCPRDPYSTMLAADGQTETDSASGDEEPHRPDSPTPQDEQRWRRILSHFRFVIVQATRPRSVGGTTSFWRRGLDKEATAHWLGEELNALPELDDLRQDLLPKLMYSTRRQTLDRIVDYASGCYLSIWDACSEAEKLVLVQLAFENVVNPKQGVVVRRLMERGLLRRDPALRLFNRSFSLFVTRIQDPAEVAEWEHHTSGFSWEQTRWVLLGLLLVGLLFLWATQRDLFNTGMMFLSASAVGLPGVFKLLSNMNKSGKAV